MLILHHGSLESPVCWLAIAVPLWPRLKINVRAWNSAASNATAREENQEEDACFYQQTQDYISRCKGRESSSSFSASPSSTSSSSSPSYMMYGRLFGLKKLTFSTKGWWLSLSFSVTTKAYGIQELRSDKVSFFFPRGS